METIPSEIISFLVRSFGRLVGWEWLGCWLDSRADSTHTHTFDSDLVSEWEKGGGGGRG